ncbi:hypothetical protein LCGC14_2392320 [marine sediment metagenome]|uniref:Uncharacterized protein n=1 Tax=marine sediment metagenome TaxID=412755 RepID=A0A0F9BXV6_9ZZZZ
MVKPKTIRNYGDRDLPSQMVKGVAQVLAYVNHGRWLSDCPECRTGLSLPRGEFVSPLMATRVGGPVIQVKPKWVLPTSGAECPVCDLPVKVMWPKDVDLIDAALEARPRLTNRNWRPGESVKSLLAETARHL